MFDWHKSRIWLLRIIFIVACLALGKSIFFSKSHPINKNSSFNFPEVVRLPGWQFVKNSDLPITSRKNKENYAGKQYLYNQKNILINIQMQYLVNTDGDINKHIKKYQQIDLNINQLQPLLRNQPGIGSYILFLHQDKAYLSACINSRGGSTVTSKEFRRNRNIHDLLSGHILLWLSGQANFRDERCLWAYLSIELNNSSSEKHYEILEKVWFSWYQWWSKNFPAP